MELIIAALVIGNVCLDVRFLGQSRHRMVLRGESANDPKQTVTAVDVKFPRLDSRSETGRLQNAWLLPN